MSRPIVVLGAVIATLAVALGTADATAGRPHPPTSSLTQGSTTTVRQATVVCPDSRGGAGQVTWVRAAGAGKGIVAGQATITANTVTSNPTDFAPAAPALGLIPYGDSYGGRIDKGNRALAFTGTGASAVGLGAVQVTRATTGLSRGIAAANCGESGTEFTFVGGSTSVGNQLKLVLTNIDDSMALVNLTLLASGGPLNIGSAEGIEVKPHTRRSIDLVRLAPGHDELTTEVTAVTGRVAAAELTSRLDGDNPRGIEWIPDAGQPSRRELVPGMLTDDGKKILVLADPGGTAANVTVQVVSDSGTFTPAGLESVSVDAGSVVSINVTSALAGHPGALLVTSDQPVAASASQELGSPTSLDTDVTWSTQTPNLNGDAVLPTVPLGPGRDVLLYLTAVHAGATVTITPNGPLSSTQPSYPVSVHVTVGDDSTVVADLGALLGTTAGNLTVRVGADPNGGPITASAVFEEQTTDGPLVGQVGLISVPGVIELPAVREDPTVAGALPGEIEPSDSP